MLLICIVLLVMSCFLLLVRKILKRMTIHRLMSTYGQKINVHSYEDINREYYYRLKHTDIDEHVLDDLEVPIIFDTINRTYTAVGREYLYGQMFIDSQRHDLLEHLITQFENQRLLQQVIYELFELSRIYSESWNLFSHSYTFTRKDILVICFSIVMSMILIIIFLSEVDVLPWLFLWLGFQSWLYTRYMQKDDVMLKETMSYCALVQTLKKLNDLHIYFEKDTQHIQEMTRCALKYTKIYRICAWIEKIDVYDVMELIKALLSLSLFQCFLLMKHKDALENDFYDIYEYVGIVDMAVSVYSLRQDYSTCIPQESLKPCLSVKACYHPILKEPVENTFVCEKSCMITGSNASGKSTFLKTIGLNLLLARTIHTCFGDEMIYYSFHLCTSIHIKDDIDTGESYYVKEIKILKQILDDVKKKKCLVLIDEILRGTNEKERIIIAEAICDVLYQSDAYVMMTTHDLRLVDLFSHIPQYCFYDNIDGQQLRWDYKIHQGICHLGNAIALLKIWGMDEDVLKRIK